MNYCTRCGAQLKENAKFCIKCGTPVRETAPGQKTSPVQKTSSVPEPSADRRPVRPEEHARERAESGILNRYPWIRFAAVAAACIVIGTLAGYAAYVLLSPDDEETETVSSAADTAYDPALDTVHETEAAQSAPVAAAPEAVAAPAAEIAEDDPPAVEADEYAAAENIAPAAAEEAQEFTDSTGINRYEFISEDVSWDTAFDRCLSRGGHLVRINSEEEYEYIKRMLESRNAKGIVYIGGRRERDSYEYHWVDENENPFGEDLNSPEYSYRWLSGEPSFSDGSSDSRMDEMFMCMIYIRDKGWFWNDIPNDVPNLDPDYFEGKASYICEYED